jgi:hypothetical protein
MTSSVDNVSTTSSTGGHGKVTFGNSHSLHISHTGHTKISNNLHLNDVLIVPNITKKTYVNQ